MKGEEENKPELLLPFIEHARHVPETLHFTLRAALQVAAISACRQ